MAVDEAITTGVGVGPCPPITLNVKWKDDVEDTPLWRSVVKSMIGESKVDRDMQKHLKYSKTVEFGGQTITVRTPTENGLWTGEQKAIARIQKQQCKAVTAAHLAAPVLQPAVPQPTVPQPAATPQSASAQPAVNPQGPVLPAFTQTSASQPTPTQSTAAQSADQLDPEMLRLFQLFMALRTTPTAA